MAKQTKSPVTTRALFQRINRKLAESGDKLLKARGAKAAQDLGEYYVVDLNKNAVSRKNVDLEALATELGVLQPYEQLSD